MTDEPESETAPREPEWRPNRKWRRHIYYKVQVRDEVSLVWRDEKPAFDLVDLARAYIADKVPATATARIMSVDGRTRQPVE
jgi:hypothetical protein